MLAVDSYMRLNGRVFVAMAGAQDDEMDRMARSKPRRVISGQELIEASDLLGRSCLSRNRTTRAMQRTEDSY